MSEVALTLPLDSVEPKTLVEGAYQRLRRDIIEGVHAPGEKLRVEHLKDQYEVGAGTLREALLLLVTDALVVAQGQRGFRVAPISIADFEDIPASCSKPRRCGNPSRSAGMTGKRAWWRPSIVCRVPSRSSANTTVTHKPLARTGKSVIAASMTR